MAVLNGWDVLTKIRAAGASMRVLFLSARDGVEDRVKVLDLGADDYMVKPFAFFELLARVRVLLHRADPPSSQPHLVIGDLELDLLKHQAFRGGKRIDLTAKEFSLLEFMLQHRGEVLPKSLICALLRQNGLR